LKTALSCLLFGHEKIRHFELNSALCIAGGVFYRLKTLARRHSACLVAPHYRKFMKKEMVGGSEASMVFKSMNIPFVFGSSGRCDISSRFNFLEIYLTLSSRELRTKSSLEDVLGGSVRF